MSFSNDHFQIFFNKTPCLRKDNSGTETTPVQNNASSTTLEQVKRFTFSAGGVYQTNFESKNLFSHESNEPQTHNETYIHNDGTGYSSGQVTDLSPREAMDYSESYQIPAHREAEDNEDMSAESGISSNSRKIRKEKMSAQGRTPGSKKAVMDAYKIKTKRNPWQPEEDEQVIDLVAKYGQSWALIASLMKYRSGKQIRDRYLNKLKPDINKGEWTEEEDDLLIVLCRKMGHKWSRIATQLPGRTEGQVKNRFYSHIKKRLPKWDGMPDTVFEDEGEEDEVNFNDEEGFMKHLQSESPMIKEESMSFGLNRDIKVAQNSVRSIQSLNCAANYNVINHQSEQEQPKAPQMSFGSFNIRINTVNQPAPAAVVKQDEKNFCQTPVRRVMNVKTGYNRYDPTDVISYDTVGNLSANDMYSGHDEVKSPFSAQTTNLHLNSTRASSFQDKEFEEVFGRMGNNMAKLQPASKPNMISFSITNGNIMTNQNSAKTLNFRGGNVENYAKGLEVNQLDFSSGSNKINLKIC